MKLSKEDLDDIADDVEVLHRLKKYEVTDKHLNALKRLMSNAVSEKRDEFAKNYIQSLIGQAVMDYHNWYVIGRRDKKAWFPD